MKLKKVLKHLDFINEIRLLACDEDNRSDSELYYGNKWDIPKQYKNWYLDTDSNGEAIGITHKINDYGVHVDVFVIYIRKEKH